LYADHWLDSDWAGNDCDIALESRRSCESAPLVTVGWQTPATITISGVSERSTCPRHSVSSRRQFSAAFSVDPASDAGRSRRRFVVSPFSRVVRRTKRATSMTQGTRSTSLLDLEDVLVFVPSRRDRVKCAGICDS
jgi:hypothetical protein